MPPTGILTTWRAKTRFAPAQLHTFSTLMHFQIAEWRTIIMDDNNKMWVNLMKGKLKNLLMERSVVPRHRQGNANINPLPNQHQTKREKNVNTTLKTWKDWPNPPTRSCGNNDVHSRGQWPCPLTTDRRMSQKRTPANKMTQSIKQSIDLVNKRIMHQSINQSISVTSQWIP